MKGIRLSLIAAVARNGVIGAGNKMPWRLSTDTQRFRRLTLGKPVILGRKTFQSIGMPLTGRTNIVVTRQDSFSAAGVRVASSFDAALVIAEETAVATGVDEIFVAGGGEIYASAIGRAHRLYITHVDATPAGDTHFPAIDPMIWKVAFSEPFAAGEKDSAATTFVIYERLAPRVLG